LAKIIVVSRMADRLRLMLEFAPDGLFLAAFGCPGHERPGKKPIKLESHLEPRNCAVSSNIINRLAAGPDGRSRRVKWRGRKVRTPQSSVPDNVREMGAPS